MDEPDAPNMNKQKPLFLFISALLLAPLAVPAASPSANLELARQLNQAFVEVAERASASVVVINVVQKPPPADEDEESLNPQEMPPEFIPREYWREYRRRMRDMPSQGQGSGVIIREDGYILTNGHVLEDAVKIEVRLQDGRIFKGQVRGVDPQSDLAVIKIDAKGLPTATLANSDATRVGEFAIAIGAPFSLDYTVTFAHVSAKGRSNIIPGFEGISMDQDFIQTDANINPGNSGGPLVNIEGEVIGINTLIRGLHTGIGFAIPSSFAREVSDQLIQNGKFTRAWLGVSIRAFRDDPDLRERIKQIHDGVVVSAIVSNGPAFSSDLKRNDIIVAVDGKPVATPQQLRTQIRGKTIGQPVMLDVFRKDKKIQLAVSPSEWLQPTNSVASNRSDPANEARSAVLGLTVQTLTPQVADDFGVANVEGVIVVEVDNGMPASVKGLRRGDIITSIDKKSVTNAKQFREAVSRANPQKGIDVNFKRDGKPRFETLKEGSH